MNKHEYKAYFPTTGKSERILLNPEHMRAVACVLISQHETPIVFIQDKDSGKTLLICIWMPEGKNDGHFHFYYEEEII